MLTLYLRPPSSVMKDRKTISQRLYLCILLCFAAVCVNAQSITVDNANLTAGTYGRNSTIAVPFSITGCFANNNVFQVWLSDATGGFAGEVMIGTYAGNHANFANGTIPAVQGAGANYKVRIKSTSPAVISAPNAANITISAVNGPVASVSPSSPLRILRPQEIYGWCSGSANNASLPLINSSTAGAAMSSTLINHITGAVTNPAYGTTSFPLTLSQHYFTFIANANVGGIISTKAYYLINSTVQLNIATSGQQSGCLPDTLQFNVITNAAGGGIGNNFPFSNYSVDWGDGNIDTFSHCNMIERNGLIKHLYEETSCSEANAAFNVIIRVLNPFSGYNPNVTCDEPAVSSFARIFRRPEAGYTKPGDYVCVNTSVTLNNTTDIGTTAGPSNVCIAQAYFTWLVDGNVVYQSANPESVRPNLTYTFTTVGMHYIQLDVDNGTCGVSTYLDSICVEPRSNPDFLINGSTTISGCAPLPFTPTNTTVLNPCRANVYSYTVYNATTNAVIPPGTVYTVTPSLFVEEPTFTFLVNGSYYIILSSTNSCGTLFSPRRFVNVLNSAEVTLPADRSYCGLQTINFATNPAHMPTFGSNAGTETYLWTVTGGTYNFVGGTTATSQYPQIQFTSYSTYTVNLQFTNTCGTVDTLQHITFYEQPTANAGNDTTICFNTTSINLTGVTTGPSTSVIWQIISGSGTLANANTNTPTYTFSAGDKAAGSVRLRYTVNKVPASVCTNATDDIVITIRPDNIVSISPKNICSGDNVNQTITSSQSGSTYAWTSTVTSGTATGNTPSSTSTLINDVLTNTGTIDAVVTYTIIASKDGCDATPKTFTVTVKPRPALTLTSSATSICSGQPVTVNMSSPVTGTLYTWSSTATPNLSGNTNQSTPVSAASFTHTLANTGTTDIVLTYTVVAFGPAPLNCEGETKTISVTIRPGVSASNAGADRVLCNVTSVTLNGNVPVVGTGVWSQLATDVTPANIVSPTSNNTNVTGLIPGVYNFVWTISGTSGSCPDTKDTVRITVRPIITTADAGTNVLVCDFSASSNHTITLAANADPARPFEAGTWTLVSPATGGAFGNINSPTSTFTFSAPGIYTLRWTITNDAGCTPTSDDVVISVFASPVAGAIASSTTVCSGSSGTLNLNGSIGNIVKWQSSLDGAIWNDIANTTTSLNYTNLTQTTLYRVIVQSSGLAAGCNLADTSANAVITVDPVSVGGILHNDTAVCTTTNSGSLYVSGYTGNIIRWEFSDNGGGIWNPITNTTNTYSFTNIPTTRQFRVVVQSGVCPIAYSSVITVTVNAGTSAAIAGPDQILCAQTSTAMVATTPAIGTGTWTQFGPATALIVSPNAGNTQITGLVPNTQYNFIWTVSGFASCPDTKDTVVVIVRPQVTPANAGIDTTICDFTTIQNNQLTLYANAPAYAFESGAWSVISPNASTIIFGNITQANTQVTFSASGDYILQWQLSNDAGCTPKRDTIVIHVFDKPLAGALTASSTDICAGQTVSINMGAFAGDVYAWQIHAQPFTGTNWVTFLSTSNPYIINNATDTFMIRSIVRSKGAVCNSFDTSSAITVNVAPPTIAGNTDADATVCANSNNGTITLTGYVGAVVRWEWSTNNGGTWTPINVTLPSIDYNNISVTTWYRAIVQSGTCPGSPSDTTIITVSAAVTQAQAGADKFLCGDTFTDLTANTPLGSETGLWQQYTGPNTATLTATNTPLITISNLITGTYQFIWTIKNNVCPDTRDTIMVTVYDTISNKIDTAQVTICAGQAVSIAGQPATGGNGSYTYQWQSSPDAVTWTDINGAINESYGFVPSATVYIRRLVTSGPCTSLGYYKLIIVQPGIDNNVINASQVVCVDVDPVVIIGSNPTGADGTFTYQWQSSTDGFTWTDVIGATLKDYDPPVLAATTQFRRMVMSALCNGPQSDTSNVVTIVVNPDADADFSYITQTGCAPFTITSSNIQPAILPALNSQYNWYANNVFIGSGTSFPGYTINNAGDSITIKLVAISAHGCKNDSIEVKFYTYPKPITGFTATDTVGCGPLTVTFTNTTPNQSAFTYFWNFGNGTTSNIANPAPVTFATNPTFKDTVYKVTLSASTICGNIDSVMYIRVKSKPKALFTPDRSSGCSPMPVTFNNTSLGLNSTYYWDFDDGVTFTTNTLAPVNHTFNTGVQDTFNVRLIAENECGRDTLIYKVVVSPNLVQLDFAVNGNQVNGCAPHVVMFINNSSGGTNFHWDFGDGNTLNTIKNIDTIYHTYNIPGSYIVYLQGTNGCSDTTGTETINVFAKPAVDFVADRYQACIGDTIHFTNQSSTGISYLWKFGDGNTSVNTNPDHKYTAAGTYTVWLIASRTYGPGNSCTDSVSKTVTVGSTLQGAFNFASAGACNLYTVTFSNQSLPASNVTWNFGDGNNGTGDVVTHTYAVNGTYNVTMQATAPGGCTYIKTTPVTINGAAGALQYTSGYVCGTTPVRFEIVNPQGIDSVKWNFGDGNTLTTTSFVTFHSYATSGTFTPSAEILTGATCRVPLQGTAPIMVDNVKAGFTLVQQLACGSTTVAFTDTSRSYFNGNTFQWFFGDGGTSAQQNPLHNYVASGNYTVMLVTTGISGCRDTARNNIFVKVNSFPVADIDAPDTACVRNPVTFISNVTSADPVNFYAWDMGLATTFSTPIVTATYVTPGNYNVRLIVGTDAGCYDTVFHLIFINPSPITRTIEDISICRGASIPLFATGASSYVWTPAQGLSCTTCPNPIASPSFTTTYVVRGFNSFGCSTTDTVIVTVHQPIDLVVSPNDTICIGQQTTIHASGAETYQWSPALGLSSSTAQSPVAKPTVTTTYRVIGYDAASCFTDTAFVVVAVGQYPIVNLGADKVLPAGTVLPLNASVTNGPIRTWVWHPANDLSCANCPNPLATIKTSICYDVTAYNIYNCPGTDTICIKSFCESTQVFIPNAFTPDNDGQNDILMVRGTGVKLVKSFRIFNRWGQVVFERANFAANAPQYGWDGRINGVIASPDVYVYTCEVVCENGTAYTYKGNTAILK